jgi:hypothetical protein
MHVALHPSSSPPAVWEVQEARPTREGLPSLTCGIRQDSVPPEREVVDCPLADGCFRTIKAHGQGCHEDQAVGLQMRLISQPLWLVEVGIYVYAYTSMRPLDFHEIGSKMAEELRNLGLGRGKTEAEAIALVRQALDMGLNLLDTAAAYGTEALIGTAIKPIPRDRVVITTKALINRGSTPIPPVRVVESLERSLRQLDTDYIDVFQLHVVPPAMYDHAFQTIAPVLLREKEKGKFRALGITETSPNDHEQRMLQRAVHDTVWDVVMLGFNMMHHNARTQIFPHTMASNIGTLLMFVVRNIFSQPGRLTAKMQELAAAGQVPQWLADTDNRLLPISMRDRGVCPSLQS